MDNEQYENICAEILGIKAVLYALSALQSDDDFLLFQSMLQSQIDTIHNELADPIVPDHFAEKTIAAMEDFLHLDKSISEKVC